MQPLSGPVGIPQIKQALELAEDIKAQFNYQGATALIWKDFHNAPDTPYTALVEGEPLPPPERPTILRTTDDLLEDFLADALDSFLPPEEQDRVLISGLEELKEPDIIKRNIARVIAAGRLQGLTWTPISFDDDMFSGKTETRISSPEARQFLENLLDSSPFRYAYFTIDGNRFECLPETG